MSYTRTIPISLGTSQTGLTLSAVLIDIAGSSVATATGSFVEIGSGDYMWTYSDSPDGFRGGVKIFSGATYKAFGAINPEEAENIDVKVSTRLAGASYTASPSASTVAAAVRNSERATYTTSGTFGEGTASVQGDVTGSVASVESLDVPSAATIAAAVWNSIRSSHVATGTFGEGVASVQGSVTGSVDSVTNIGELDVPSAATIAAEVDSVLSASHGSGTWGGSAGAGATRHVHTVVDGNTLPVAGVDCWITTGLDSAANVVSSAVTNSSGEAVLFLDAGSYYLWQQKHGYTFSNPVTVVIA